MTIIISSFQVLLLPIMALFGFLGWRRGVYREIGNAAGLAIALVLTAAALGGPFLVGIVNRSVVLGPRIINLLLGRGDVGATLEPPIPENLFDARNLLFRIVFFLVVAVLTYSVTFPWERGAKGGYRSPANFFEKALGAVFGAGVGFLWFAAFQTFSNEVAIIQNDQPVLSRGLTLDLPLVASTETVVSFLPTLVVLAIVILLILIVFRIPKIWQ